MRLPVIERPERLRAAWFHLSARNALLADLPFIAVAMVLALFIRLEFVLSYDFPLNDGGMFYTMIRDIQQAGYALPAFTSYNAQNIPFAYPPLALYVGTLLDGLAPFGLLEVFRFVPLVLSLLVVLAAYLLIRAMLSSPLASGLALVAFVLMPRSHAWLLVGGGLTRATGLLFALLALLAAYRLFRQRDLRYLWAAVPLSALTFLSHPEIGWFTTFSILLFFTFFGIHRQGALGIAAIGLGALVLTAPWWLTVLARHGPEPFLAAASTGNHHDMKSFLLSLFQWRYTEEGDIPLLAALGTVGVFPAVARRMYVLPVWLVAMFILEPRSAATYATIPLAMLIGVFFAYLVVPLVPWRHLFRRPSIAVQEHFAGDGVPWGIRPVRSLPWHPDLPYWPMAVAFLLTFTYAFILAFGTARSSNAQVLEAVSPEDGRAMAWVAKHTPPDSRFAILTYDFWADDGVTEWFPALAGRQSLSTAQGKEWLHGQSFQDAIGRHDGLAVCSLQDIQCVERWALHEGLAYDYIYMSAGCCRGGFVDGLQEGRGYRLVYSDGPVGIWKHEPGAK